MGLDGREPAKKREQRGTGASHAQRPDSHLLVLLGYPDRGGRSVLLGGTSGTEGAFDIESIDAVGAEY